MKLVIVESPTKARKLKEYLGSGYKVEASVGHVRDLPKSGLGVDVEHNFKPTYEVSSDKVAVVDKLRKYGQTADEIVLATDPDREGEAIAWHIRELLQDDVKAHFVRATFHEITKSAVLEAIAHPKQVSLPLVDAQQARRVLDRLVGYTVSPVLWKKVRRGLSAGRVQSVALKLIAEREREIEKFVPEEYWEVSIALFADEVSEALRKKVASWLEPKKVAAKKSEKNDSDAENKTAESLEVVHKNITTLPQNVIIASIATVGGKSFEPHTEQEVTSVLSHIPTAKITIQKIERKSRERSSLPPFTTSTLQQAAANRLGMTSKQTMSLAQQLYEEGLITYHRTDSVSLSQSAVAQARTYIQKSFGDRYVPEKPRFFANKTKNAQEAHEAIRVTDLQQKSIRTVSARFTERHQQLYDLIWKRFVASQMSSAQYDQTTIIFDAIDGEHQSELKASGSILRFDGWMRLFPGGEDVVLPDLSEGQPVSYVAHQAYQKFTQPPARYNDASLVKELEKRGIGRPSTYASIISVIVDRGYIERREKRFFATSVGLAVCDFLNKHFPIFMEYDFTAEMEEDLDRVSRGEKSWETIVGNFYKPLSRTISEVEKNADRVQIPVEATGESCPICGETEHGKVVIRTGKYGKFKSCSRFPDCSYTDNMLPKLDGVVCPLCQQGEVLMKPSRWGKAFFGCSRYPACDWASWTKPEPGARVTPEAWAKAQAERAAKRAAKLAERAGKESPSKASKQKKAATKSGSRTKRVATKKSAVSKTKTKS